MLKYFTPLLLSLAALPSYAQKVSISWSPESKSELTYYSFVPGEGNDLVKLCFEEERKTILPIMTRYNNKLEEQTVNNITVAEDGIKFDRFLSLRNRLYFFTNQYDKKTKATTFFCQPLNIKTFKADGANINLGTFDAIKKSEQSTVTYSLSKDSSKVLMMGLSPYSKNDVEKYYIGVYDSKMSKMWDNTIEMPYKDKFINILSTIVTNDGKVGILIKHYDQETNKEDIRKGGKKTPSYTTKLLLYSKEETKPHEFVLDMGGKFVHNLALAEEDGNNLVLFGLYQLKSEGNVNGYFIASVNKNTKAVSLSNMLPFPANLLELVDNDKQGNDNSKDPGLGNDFSFVKVITRENGDKDYLIEYRIAQWVTVRTQYSSYSYMLYVYGDIINISVKKDGKNIISRIPKRQMATGDDKFVSFEAMAYKDKLLVFYNDDDENLKKDLSKKPEEIKFGRENATFAMATINSQGDVSRTTLIGKKQTKFTTGINVSFPVASNKIALYASKGGLFQHTKDMVGLLEVK